jgi:hypothetical protein
MKYLKYIIPSIIALGVSVALAATPPTANNLLIFNGTNFSSTTTNPLYVGSILATSTTATSTFANGLNLTGGCFELNGVCISGGGTPGGSNTQIQVNSSNTFAGYSSLTYDGSSVLTVGKLQATTLNNVALVASQGQFTIKAGASSGGGGTGALSSISGGNATAASGSNGGSTIIQQSAGDVGNGGLDGRILLQKSDGTTHVDFSLDSLSTSRTLTAPDKSGTIALTTDLPSSDWNKQTNYGVLALTPTTTIPVWLKDQLFASSSAIFAGNVTANTFIATGTTASSLPYASTTAITSSGSAYFATLGGNVGIGTTSPWANLSVTGISNGTSPLFTVASTTGVATATAFIIDSNGKVGIGTTSPSYQLEVAGNEYVRSNLVVGSNVSANNMSAVQFTAGGSFLKSSLINLNGPQLTTSGNGLGLNNGYNFGISTSSPWGMLSINGTSSQSSLIPLFVVATSTPNSTTTAVLIDSNGNLAVGPNASVSNGAALNVNGTSYFNGLVGISTTSPISNLAVVGSVTFSGTGSTILNVNNNTTGSSYVSAGSGVSSGGSLTISNGSAGGLVFTGNSSTGNSTVNNANTVGGDWALQNRGLNTMTLKVGGNVGISSTSPYAELSVSNSRTSVANTPLFLVASTTNGTATTTAFSITSSGEILTAGIAPLISTSTGSGTGAVPAVIVYSTPNSATINITTGTAPAGSNALIATVTFPAACNIYPIPILTDGNANADALGIAALTFASSTANNAVGIYSGATGLTGATVYIWNLHIDCPSL